MGAALIGALFGSATAAASQDPAYSSYKLLQKTRTNLEERCFKDPQRKRDLDYFQSKATSVKSLDDLFKDRRLLQFTLGAFQLEDQVDMKGFLKKIMTSDPSDPTSLANRMNDARFKQVSQVVQGLIAGDGFSSSDVAAITAGWKTNEFEKNQGERNPALREALYFTRSVSGIKNGYQILANATLSKVARGALNLPDSFAALDVDQQARILNSKLKYEDFSNPNYVNKFVDRYLVNSDIQAMSATSGGAGSILNLFA